MDQHSSRPATTAEEYSFISQSSAREQHSESLTLLRRSRRVLGDIDLDEASIPLSGDTESSQSEQAAANKRREQVRKAQRTHRQRTQSYIKELEKEVLRLRTCKSNALARVESLESRVETLLHTLSKHRIPAPRFEDERRAAAAASSDTAHVVVGTQDDLSAAHINLSFPPPLPPLPPPATQATQAGDVVPYATAGVTPAVSPAEPRLLANPGAGFLSENMQPSLLSDPRVGIDFILALERLCLDHIRQSHLDYDDRAEQPDERARYTSHHIFTASLQLWNPSLRSRSAQESYDVSAAEVERLLNTSLNIGVSDDEITPVQIWHHLKNFTLPLERERDFLDKITEELCKIVECIHFGAVIPVRNFNAVLREYLPEAVIPL